ncbi:hypothetical protein AGDE_14731 [Angomonas deanei]|uniref:Uncharacterized protein n=1 Tax=Angomonas deanei TaxID=59799 RepID=A0A7G2BZU8_9TRYP|nr:hypothetical protein AGDE_14731 [Angomonas deanei]CAD2213058.1 hypothetical protein, conserved [Angomonas deanei]|eukprot:EPY20338.1 hypothetical protein AGDE_14731 [Angomonas deanei]
MYNRAEVDSLKFALSMYYALVPTVLRSSPSVSLNQGEAVDSGVQPPFLLVGTNITAPPYSSRQEEEAIPDEALMHSNLDAVIKERKRNAARHAPSAVGNALQVLSEMVRCFTSPGTILSVQNQEGLSKLEEDCQSCGAVRSTYQWCVSLIAHVVYFFDNLCSYVMAVILFGPRQRFVSLDQRGNTELIGRITRDAQCVGHLAACPLYSSIHFDESVTELTNFLDLLHQKKCAS